MQGWKGQDPMARSVADAIQHQVGERYGIDVAALGTGAPGVAAPNEAACWILGVRSSAAGWRG